MAKTKNQLVERAMLRLGVLDAGESPSSVDLTYVGAEYDTALEQLRDIGLAYWPNTNGTTADIPDVVFGALVSIMLGRIAGAFGQEEPGETDLMTGEVLPAGTVGMRLLRRHMAKRTSNEATQTNYF